MANYETAAGIEAVLDSAVNDGGVSQATADAINALIADLQVSGGASAVASAVATGVATITAENVAAVTAPVVMMADNTSVNATFDASSDVQAIILGKTGQASDITFNTTKDVTVQLGGATGDVVTTGAGSDSITFAGGSATVDTGAGNDTIVIQGAGSLNVKQGGSGDLNIRLETGSASATIDAGDGFDRLGLDDARTNHSFEFVGGKFVMHSENEVVMDGVNVVTFENTAGDIQNLSVLASTEGQAMVGRIYKVALGREAIDGDAAGGTNVDGLNFWLDTYEDSIVSNANASDAQLEHVYQAMLACPEFGEKYAGMTDEQFVQAMMGNMGSGVTTVNGITAAEYAAQLAAGRLTRADLAIDFAQSSEAVAALGIDGTGYVIEGF